MTASRLLKFLALVSIGATLAAVMHWQQTGTAAPTWLVRVSLGAFILALAVGLIGAETRPRLMLRFLSALAALIGTIALITDLARTGGGLTALSDHLAQFSPSILTSMKAALTRSLGAAAWDPVATTILALPTSVVFAALALVTGYASRRRETVRIFMN